MKVVIYQIPGHERSKVICAAWRQGLAAVGQDYTVRSSVTYLRPDADVAIFYGLSGRLAHALRDYPAAGRTALYVDLGYWGRKDATKEGRFTGFHKISVNGRHPTAYFQARAHSDDRFATSGLVVRPWQPPGSSVLIVGMGPKGSAAEGYPALGWETEALGVMRARTRRPFIYRPKPNWQAPPRLPGASMAPAGQSLEDALRDCHAVVAHHSNAAVEAIVAGVPAFVAEGVAVPMASTDLTQIENPVRPDGREQWLADIAYTQWSVAEIATGLPWLHLKSEGLV